ncbi:Biopolymer transport protein ExbD/TolR [Pseudodesulfovibrio mercurii]|uniref:Biopolymer transport protein ExbD/TolR n=1 Tax=Pseudodesulfovibrio mercurii TaxID=641491 RepID=F0JCJ4_9BACT|nr:biopolymer transporter ExbD [Pseudodesulfovibrio mercurii]EGB15674.1 Biopolymer transport protein ExbD/TolR [Pseudodesulfovibrio mercurii]
MTASARTATARIRQSLPDDIPAMPVSLSEIGFVLSLIFMCSFIMILANGAMMQEKTLPQVDLTQMRRQGESEAAQPPETRISITMTDGAADCFLGERKVPMDRLPDALREEKVREVAIRADNLVTNGTIMKVIRACRQGEVQSFTFVYEETQ